MANFRLLKQALSATALSFAAVIAATPAGAADRSVLSQLPPQGLGPNYAWVQVPPSTQGETDPKVDNSIVRTRLQNAVDYALQGLGYRLAPSPAQADFLVAYRVGVQQRTDVVSDGFDCCWGGWAGWGGWGWGAFGPPDDMSVDTIHYTQGTLMIDILDKSGNLIWRGTSEQTVHNKTANQDVLDKIATKTLAKLGAPGTPQN